MAATARTSPTPDGPVASSPVTGTSALWTWFQKIISFIGSLSPSGAAAYDTGWVSVTLESGFTGGSAVIRRVGKLVTFQASTVAGTFPVGVTTILTAVPTGFKASRTFRGGCYLTQCAGLVGTDTSGAIQIFNQTGATRTSAQISLSWYVD